MELSTTWEATDYATTKELLKILCNPKVHYHIHKSPFTGPYPEPDQFSPYLSKIHLNIIHPLTSFPL
jgi:hypothetical protein